MSRTLRIVHAANDTSAQNGGTSAHIDVDEAPCGGYTVFACQLFHVHDPNDALRVEEALTAYFNTMGYEMVAASPEEVAHYNK